MKALIQQILITIVAMILFSYGTAIGLSFIHNPTPEQIEIIKALTTNASNGSKAFFELVNGEQLKALLPKMVHLSETWHPEFFLISKKNIEIQW